MATSLKSLSLFQSLGTGGASGLRDLLTDLTHPSTSEAPNKPSDLLE